MKYLATLVFSFSLFALTPLAHADTFNLCSVTLQTGQSCFSCHDSCVAGDTCRISDNTCQPINGGTSTKPPTQTQTPGSNPTQTQTPGQNTNGTTPPAQGAPVSLLNPLNTGTSLPALLQEILGFVIQIGTVIIVLMVVYVGFKFVMAQGNASALEEARQALLWTVVGALILLGAQAIATAIQATATAL